MVVKKIAWIIVTSGVVPIPVALASWLIASSIATTNLS